MRRPRAIALVALAISGLALAGCSSSGDKATTAPSSSANAGSFPVTVGDVTLTAKPTHIVSLSPTATDMLFAIGAGPQVVAVDKYSDQFHGQPKPPSDLDGNSPNAEAIAAKNPDLVVVSNDIKIKDQLTKLKIPVYVAPAAVTLDDSYKQETELGKLTGHVDGATAVVDGEKKSIATTLAAVPNRAKPLTYYVELDPTFYSVTSKTFIGSLFTMAKMANIADPADADGKAGGYPQLSSEAIVKANPNLIFLADTVCCQQSAATVAKRSGWSSINAVSKNQIIGINDSTFSQWGTGVPQLFQAIVDAENAYPAS